VKYSFIVSWYVWDSNYKLPVTNYLNVHADTKTFESYGQTNSNQENKRFLLKPARRNLESYDNKPTQKMVPILIEVLWIIILTLNLLTTTIVAPPTNVSKWQMGFNSAFKGLNRLH